MLGNTLKRLRGIYGYSAKEMSELLGISSSYLSEIENGKKKSRWICSNAIQNCLVFECQR